jgi:hypothetical protein
MKNITIIVRRKREKNLLKYFVKGIGFCILEVRDKLNFYAYHCISSLQQFPKNKAGATYESRHSLVCLANFQIAPACPLLTVKKFAK